MRLQNPFSRTNSRIERTANNPFEGKPPIERFTIDGKRFPKYLTEYEQYSEGIKDLGHSLPWFGHDQLAPPKTISAADIKNRTVPAIRRVLISVLAGRPFSHAAKRVPTSRRTLYKILSEVIYSWDPDLNPWIELGLVAVWDAPKNKLNLDKMPSRFWDMAEGSPIYCLLCHRVIDYAFLKDRSHDSSLVHPADGRLHKDPKTYPIGAIAHMVCHFYLGSTPAPNLRHIGSYGPEKRHYRRPAKSWLHSKPDGITRLLIFLDFKPPLPLTNGREPSHDAVEKHYLSLL